VVKLKGVAVVADARGLGLGAALIKRNVRLYTQLGWHVAYGQFQAGSGSDAYYRRLDFDVLDADEPLDLYKLIGFPLSIHPSPGQRLFVRWR
jgi:GNAT superfamily N-acetyltransferase